MHRSISFRFLLVFGLAALGVFTPPLSAKPQKTGKFDRVIAVTMADIADRVLDAPLVAQVRVRQAKRLAPKKGGSRLPMRQRLLMTGDVVSLIRGDGGLASRITWIVDQRPDARGGYPKLKGEMVIIAAKRVPGFPNEVQMVDPDAQFYLTAGVARRVRTLIVEASSPDAPPALAGVDAIFHTPGAVEGEGETQVFLSTRSGKPISLSIVEAPGQAPSWGVQLGEAVGDVTAPPLAETLLWYRLACSLPATPPAEALSGDDQDAASRAYGFVVRELGECRRALPLSVSRKAQLAVQ